MMLRYVDMSTSIQCLATKTTFSITLRSRAAAILVAKAERHTVDVGGLFGLRRHAGLLCLTRRWRDFLQRMKKSALTDGELGVSTLALYEVSVE